MLDQLKELSKFEFISVILGSEMDSYKFGWKNGLHFYIDDFFENDEIEGRYIMVIFLNKEMKLCQDFRETEPLIEKIKEFLK